MVFFVGLERARESRHELRDAAEIHLSYNFGIIINYHVYHGLDTIDTKSDDFSLGLFVMALFSLKLTSVENKF